MVTDAHGAAQLVADVLCRLLTVKRSAVLGLATGRTMAPAYAELSRRYRAGLVSLANATAVMLDEYLDLPASHPATFGSYLQRAVIDRTDLPPESLIGPDVHAANLDQACRLYERRIHDLGGVDLQLLGIGSNGHIGFNEPPATAATTTRVVPLDRRTRLDNAGPFCGLDDTPTRAITQGVGTILGARRIVLVALGTSKAAAVRAAVEFTPSEAAPASALRAHLDCTFILDIEAAAMLTRAPR